MSEHARNALLRRVDWRFLVQSRDEPRIAAPADEMAQSLALVSLARLPSHSTTRLDVCGVTAVTVVSPTWPTTTDRSLAHMSEMV